MGRVGMVLVLVAEFVMGRVCQGPSLSWAEFVMGRDVPESFFIFTNDFFVIRLILSYNFPQILYLHHHSAFC